MVLLIVVAGLVWVLRARRGGDADHDAVSTRVARTATVNNNGDVVLDAAAAMNANLSTAILQTAGSAAAGGATVGIGTTQVQGELISDPARTTTIRAAVPGRLSSSHWPTMGEAVALGLVVGQVSDAKPLSAPRAGTVTHIGAQPGELVQAGQELLQLTDFSAPIARIVWRGTLGAPSPTITVAPLDGSTAGVRAQLIGISPEVDTLTRTPTYLYRLAGSWPGARPGLPVVATLGDRRMASVDGARASTVTVFVPDAAVIQWNALAWVYVERAARRFVRVRVFTEHPTAGGYLVAAGALKPGDRVVVRGAQQILSEEFKAQPAGGDEDGK